MNNKKEYYFITVFTKLEQNKGFLVNVGIKRCWGFYEDKGTAIKAVEENWTDLNETIFDYALIEGYNEGIGHYTGFRKLFKYDYQSNRYVEIDEPDFLDRHICFAIG